MPWLPHQVARCYTDARRSDPPRGARLVRRTVLVALLLVSGSMLSSSAIELLFRSQESQESLRVAQQEMADKAALQVQQFITEIHHRLQEATQTVDVMTVGLTATYRFQLLKLLRLAPAITTAMALDPTGHEVLKASREQLVLAEDLLDRGNEEAVARARAGTAFFGSVYFVRQSEPYMRMAVPIMRATGTVIGVLMADVNLTYIWDVITRIHAGHAGYAYVVSATGDLIAHPDISLVLQRQNLRHLPQVRAALGQAPALLQAQPNLMGQPVLATSAAMATLGWVVLVERPASEAYAPLYASVVRTLALLGVSLSIAGLVSRLLSHRVVRPLVQLQEGAVRLGQGDLAYRLCITTADEFQCVAEEFNRMATQLQTLYGGLEQQVAERTHALEERSRQLAIASAHKSQFLAQMSHELRTPLNAILGYTELMLDAIYGDVPPAIRQVLDRVHFSGQHLLRLINDVLDISKMEAGEWRLLLTDYAMRDVVQKVVTTMEALATEKGLALTVTMPDILPLGKGDEQRLVQVLMNLVGNAIKFTEVGTVQMQVAVCEGAFLLAVSDTGPGIALAEQQTIFEQFQQTEQTRTRAQGGTGLGLAIVKRIVDMHGGHVWVESCPGQGATFRVTLPVCVEHQQEVV